MGSLLLPRQNDRDGHPDYAIRSLLKEWFSTDKTRLPWFHSSWAGNEVSRQCSLAAITFYYTNQAPNQAFDDRMSIGI